MSSRVMERKLLAARFQIRRAGAMLATKTWCGTILLLLAAVLATAAAPSCTSAATTLTEPAPLGSGREQAKEGDADARSARSRSADVAPRHGPPLHELRGRAEDRDYKGQLSPDVTHRKGLAVIADFSNVRLEDWRGPGISSVAQLRDQLRRMEEHWAWLSRGLETFRWDIIRVTLPVALRPDAYPGWIEYRDAVASLVRKKVNAPSYDANRDSIIDTVWVIASSNGCIECTFLIGGASQNAGANVFVDGQDSLSIAVGATGNFNHEAAHTIGIPDLYGPYGTISYLSVMADSWANPPNDFTAYERMLLGWVEPQVVDGTRRDIRLSLPDGRMRAVRVPGAHRSEYFLIEYRRRPGSGFGSTAPVRYLGLAVYHVLEGSHQYLDPPLLKLEPADGSIAPDTSPEETDFFYPGNPGMRTPSVLRSYFGNKEVFRLKNLRRTRGGVLTFDIEMAPRSPLSNILANSSFESSRGRSPNAWKSDAFQASAVFDLDTRIAKRGRHSVSISAMMPNDARWVQAVSGLTSGQSYALCGWLRGQNITTTREAAVGANISIIGGFSRSESRSGSFDWAESCVVFKPDVTDIQVACRLGFYGSTVTGKVWCDDMTLALLRSAF